MPIDHFIADFVCLSHRLVIEVDGATHSTDEEIARDVSRQSYIESQGFMVLRFTNTDVVTNIDGVMDTVVGALDQRASKITPTPVPSPQGGGALLPVNLK